jgi:hypothetical protein
MSHLKSSEPGAVVLTGRGILSVCGRGSLSSIHLQFHSR